MNDSLNPVTLTMVRNALDVASMRHAAYSHNIANAGSPGFAPIRVDFHNSLEQAQRRLAEEANGATSAPEVTLARDDSGSGVDLIEEVAGMTLNGLQYQALIRALNKEMSIAALALSEGRK